MAFLLLCSTVSFTLQKHFCGDELIEVSVFSSLDGCGMDMGSATIATLEKKECCKDEIHLIKGQDQLKLTNFNNLSFGHQLFLTTYIYSYMNLFEGLPMQSIPHKDYFPPNLVADIQVLDQVFII